MSSYISCFRNRYNAEQKQRLLELLTLSKFELIEASLPVFISASISSGMSSIILVIASRTLNLEIILASFYAAIIFILFKILTYKLLKSETLQSSFILINIIRKYKLSKISRKSIVEISGFAWKDCFVNISLRLIFNNSGLGPSFGSWLLIIAMLCISIAVSSYIQRLYIPEGLYSQVNFKLLLFDTEAFTLCIAFILTVLVMLSINSSGFTISSDNSYLFNWKNNYDYDNIGFNICYLLYVIIVTFIAATTYFDITNHDISMAHHSSNETNVDSKINHNNNNHNNIHISNNNNNDDVINILNVTSSDSPSNNTSNSSSTSASNDYEMSHNSLSHPHNNHISSSSNNYEEPSHSIISPITVPSSACYFNMKTTMSIYLHIIPTSYTLLFKEFWNNFVGYLAGIAYLVLLVDFFRVPFTNDELTNNLITNTIVAIFLSWRAPHMLASIKLKYEIQKVDIEKLRQDIITATETLENSSTSYSSISYTKKTCIETNIASCVNSYNKVVAHILKIRLNRKSVLIKALRLVLGWIWEICIIDLFEIIGSSGSLSLVVKVFLYVIFAILISIGTVSIHLYVRDWTPEEYDEDQEQEISTHSTHK